MLANPLYQDISEFIYIDDILKNVKGMGQACEENGINYYGFVCHFK
jgi:hypothetical protein